MKKITRKEYDKALDTVEVFQEIRKKYIDASIVVEAFHKQLLNLPLSAAEARSMAGDSKTKARDWCMFEKCSVRLQNILTNHVKEGSPLEFIEEIKANDFRKEHQAGKGSWLEFINLRGY